MDHVIITGTGTGIGKAIAEAFLAKGYYKVYGFSRTQSIENRHYSHKKIDLSDLSETKKINFEFIKPDREDEKIILINNAGIIEPVSHIGNANNDDLITHFSVNLIAPVILSNSFINWGKTNHNKKIIVNVSSGAGKYPVDGWGAYCAGKAGLDMFTRVLDLERKISGTNILAFAIAPGIVDTPMQEKIRNSNSSEFSRKEEFVGYKTNHQLAKSERVAEEYVKLIEEPEKINDIIYRIN